MESDAGKHKQNKWKAGEGSYPSPADSGTELSQEKLKGLGLGHNPLGPWSQRVFQGRGRWAQLKRRFRRFYYGLFHQKYIEASIAQTREGDCHRCGACCKLVYECPFLGADSQNLPYCRIYGDLRPVNCHSYPFDALDAEVPWCGFSFKK